MIFKGFLNFNNLITLLLHRHTLRQIPWLIDIGAFNDSDVIREKLHGDSVENGGDKGVYFPCDDGPCWDVFKRAGAFLIRD